MVVISDIMSNYCYKYYATLGDIAHVGVTVTRGELRIKSTIACVAER